MSKRVDIAIIGSGVAGISAALNAKIRKKSFLLFGSEELSNKIVKASQINNYLGLPAVSGTDMVQHMKDHMKSMEVEVTEDKITTIYNMGEYYSLMSKDNFYEATTVILATGVNFGKPLKGEEEFLGSGVGYCATCDAPLYRDKVVTIIAYNKHEENEANFMASIASKVYYIPMYKEEVEVDEKIEVVRDTPVEIVGDDVVTKLICKEREIETDGVFLLRDSTPPAQLVPGLKLDGNHVEVDRLMKTNLPGCFAAGDIVGVPYQYIKAAGEGNIAALSAVAYIDNKKKEEK